MVGAGAGIRGRSGSEINDEGTLRVDFEAYLNDVMAKSERNKSARLLNEAFNSVKYEPNAIQSSPDQGYNYVSNILYYSLLF